MRTERLQADNPADVERAARLLREGRTVAFPTETVYGLGANALSGPAVEQIFAAKQRPHWDPLIVHVPDRDALARIGTTNPLSYHLMNAFWPGPLTLLLPRTQAIPDSVTAGRPLVGVRCPAHPVAHALLRLAGVPIAAPSANRFGHTSPTTAAHVLDDLDGRIHAVLDGGPTQVGVESTVVEARDAAVIIYRAGAVTSEMLATVAGVDSVTLYQPVESPVPVESLPSPGVGLRHYAPHATLVLVEEPEAELQAALARAVASAKSTGVRTGVMVPEGWAHTAADSVFAWGPWTDPATLAHNLFAGLRALDQAGAEVILCPLPPPGGLGDALRDRLQKAARKH